MCKEIHAKTESKVGKKSGIKSAGEMLSVISLGKDTTHARCLREVSQLFDAACCP